VRALEEESKKDAPPRWGKKGNDKVLQIWGGGLRAIGLLMGVKDCLLKKGGERGREREMLALRFCYKGGRPPLSYLQSRGKEKPQGTEGESPLWNTKPQLTYRGEESEEEKILGKGTSLSTKNLL